MPKVRKHKFKYSQVPPMQDNTDKQNSDVTKRQQRMAELELELAALKAAEKSNVDSSGTFSSSPCWSPDQPLCTPQEKLFARLPQGRAKTILGLALRIPSASSPALS